MYLDRDWRIPERTDSPIVWEQADERIAFWSAYCCGWHVTGTATCFTDPMGLLVTFGNEWQPMHVLVDDPVPVVNQE